MASTCEDFYWCKMIDYLRKLKPAEIPDYLHKVIDLIGFEAFEALIDNFGGIDLYIPVETVSQNRVRNRKIIRDYGEMKNKSALSRSYQLSYRYTRRIISSVDAETEVSCKIELNDFTERQQQIAHCIGFENFMKLVRQYSGTRIRLPMRKTLERPARDRELARDYFIHGITSFDELAEKYGISSLRAYEIIREQDDDTYSDIVSDKITEQKRNKRKIEQNAKRKRNRQQKAIEKRDKAIIDDILSGGFTYYDLAKKHNCGLRTITRVVKQAGSRHTLLTERNNRIISDFISGMNCENIAEKYHMSLVRIYEIVRPLRKKEQEKSKK